MAETFPETPMLGAPDALGAPGRPPGFFPDSPRLAEAPTQYTDPSGDSEPADRQEYLLVERDCEEDEAALDVRSGRLDTLGWVSSSWEPRCVVLRTDGSMSVQPLGRVGRKKLAQQQSARGGGSGYVGSTQSSPAPAHWSPMMIKLKGRNMPTSSNTNMTERLTSWASNSSNGSSSMKSGTSTRLSTSFLASITAAAGGGGSGAGANGNGVAIAQSPGSSVSAGSMEKVKTTVPWQRGGRGYDWVLTLVIFNTTSIHCRVSEWGVHFCYMSSRWGVDNPEVGASLVGSHGWGGKVI